MCRVTQNIAANPMAQSTPRALPPASGAGIAGAGTLSASNAVSAAAAAASSPARDQNRKLALLLDDAMF